MNLQVVITYILLSGFSDGHVNHDKRLDDIAKRQTINQCS